MTNTTTTTRETKISKISNLNFDLGKVWEVSELPNKSIALDGAVAGSYFDAKREIFSLDHHTGVERTITKSTCKQVLTCLNLGLNPSGFNIFINELDADTVLSAWALLHPSLAKSTFARDIINAVGEVDSHGSSIDLDYIIYTPYAGDMTKAQAFVDRFFDFCMEKVPAKWEQKNHTNGQLLSILYETLSKVSEFMERFGEVETQPQSTKSFEVVNSKNGVVLATSKDYITDVLYQKGYTFLIMYTDLGKGMYKYTLAKKSMFVHSDIDLVSLYQELNKLESIEDGDSNRWNGANTIGGSPKQGGSRLKPQDIFNLIVK